MLEPIRDFIVVSIIQEQQTASLIIRPSSAEEKIVLGKVIEAGSGYLTDSGASVALEVKAGDKVLFNKQMAVEVKHNGETFHLLREENILSKVRS